MKRRPAATLAVALAWVLSLPGHEIVLLNKNIVKVSLPTVRYAYESGLI